MFNNTFLECINCGFITDLLKERDFRCPRCNDLYDVIHNIPGRSPKEWKDWFEDRHHWKKINSGVWKFKEWIMPWLKNEDIVTLGEGFVPIVPAGPNLKKWVGGDIDIWLILEGKSPTGSFKDFGMTVLVSVAKAAGIKTIACASTGEHFSFSGSILRRGRNKMRCYSTRRKNNPRTNSPGQTFWRNNSAASRKFRCLHESS